jgi:hypothetical protein
VNSKESIKDNNDDNNNNIYNKKIINNIWAVSVTCCEVGAVCLRLQEGRKRKKYNKEIMKKEKQKCWK